MKSKRYERFASNLRKVIFGGFALSVTFALPTATRAQATLSESKSASAVFFDNDPAGCLSITIDASQTLNVSAR